MHLNIKIGLRIIKSVLAAYICFVIDVIRGSGVPFYGAIAAILCMQKDVKSSIKTGKNRMIATINGGLFGAIYLFIEQNHLYLNNDLIRYTLLSILLIPVIYLALFIKQEASVALSCVVFLSVTINHANESPLSFALNRTIDTLIGVIVAIFINWFLFKVVDAYKYLRNKES